MKNRDQISANKQLDHKAKQLAHRHQQQLREMTEVALTTPGKRNLNWLSPQPALALSAFAIAVSVYWVMPSPENNVIPSTPQIAVIPGWVLDDQVPLELLGSLEFYQWLAKQEQAQKSEQQG